MKKGSVIKQRAAMARGIFTMIFIYLCIVTPVSVFCADKLIVKNASGTTTFKVEDNGSIASASRLLSNGASAWGSAPFVLGQNVGNRGIVITDKATSNQKNIYIQTFPGPYECHKTINQHW